MKAEIISSPAIPEIEMIGVTVSSAKAPDTAVISEVNWTVMPGDYWVVGGPPGSGKTDLLTTAAGLLRPIRGVHRLFGEEIDRLPEPEAIEKRLRIGLVFSDEGRLFSHLSIFENVALPICYHRNCGAAEAAEQVSALLQRLGLSSVAQSVPGRLHRNMRQRAALARALALEPEALLLDDPLRGLDLIEAKWWLEFLSSLCSRDERALDRRTTLIITTENFRPWMQQASQFALISDGQWTPLGQREELERHQHPTLNELMTSGF